MGKIKSAKCGNCLFAEAEPTQEMWGFCHRYPPSECTEPDGMVSSDFPSIFKSDWCGEHKPCESLKMGHKRKTATTRSLRRKDAKGEGD
jgi:hypothetical protein